MNQSKSPPFFRLLLASSPTPFRSFEYLLASESSDSRAADIHPSVSIAFFTTERLASRVLRPPLPSRDRSFSLTATRTRGIPAVPRIHVRVINSGLLALCTASHPQPPPNSPISRTFRRFPIFQTAPIPSGVSPRSFFNVALSFPPPLFRQLREYRFDSIERAATLRIL